MRYRRPWAFALTPLVLPLSGYSFRLAREFWQWIQRHAQPEPLPPPPPRPATARRPRHAPAYTCPHCYRATYHTDDIRHAYCPCCGSVDAPKLCEHQL